MKYMWLPVACDVPITGTTLSTIKACYDQHVRWMWGSMDIGFFLVRCLLDVPGAPSVPLWRKVYLFLTMYEFHLLYPAMWIIIAITINLYGIDMSQYYKMVRGMAANWRQKPEISSMPCRLLQFMSFCSTSYAATFAFVKWRWPTACMYTRR